MEIHQARQSKKRELRKQSLKYRRAIENQLDEGVNDLRKVVRMMAVGGAVGLGVYTLISLFSSGKGKDDVRRTEYLPATVHPPETSLSRLIKEKIALFLLSLALERLKNYLVKENPQNDPAHPAEAAPAEGNPE